MGFGESRRSRRKGVWEPRGKLLGKQREVYEGTKGRVGGNYRIKRIGEQWGRVGGWEGTRGRGER